MKGRTVGLTVGAAFIIAGAAWTYSDYQSWYALGPAGVPHNFQGAGCR